MICEICGEEVDDKAVYCPFCGANIKIQRKWSFEDFNSDKKNSEEQNYKMELKNVHPIQNNTKTSPHSILSSKIDLLTQYQSLNQELEKYDKIDVAFDQHQTYYNTLFRDFQNMQNNLKAKQSQTQKELADVEELKKLSWTSFKARVKGNKDDQIKKEEMEYFDALRQEEALRRDVQNLQTRVDVAYKQFQHLKYMVDQKKKLEQDILRVIDIACEGIPDAIEDPIENKLLELKTRQQPLLIQRNNLKNGLGHLKNAQTHFNRALSQLDKAMNYSDWDTFFGGGFFVDSMKHSKVDNARDSVHQAHRSLEMAFQVLPQTPAIRGAKVAENNYFWDMFMDNIFSDLSARKKIRQSVESVEITLHDTNNAVNWLQQELEKIDRTYRQLDEEINQTRNQLTQERRRMIEEALQNH